MKKILLVLMAITSLNLNAQIDRTKTQNNPRGLLGYEQSRILYQGVEYEFWAIANGYEDTELQGENVEIIENPDDAFRYFVVPDSIGTCTLRVVALIESREKSVAMRSDMFRVMPKPNPTVILGKTWSGNKLGKENSTIHCRYDMNTALRGSFEIDSWVVKINDKVYKGVGNDLSKELIAEIEKLKSDTPIIVKVLCNGGGEKLDLIGVFLK